jgi:hypothetical protein
MPKVSEEERERRVIVAATAITTPYAQPQTRRKMRTYACRMVDALIAYEEREAEPDA